MWIKTKYEWKLLATKLNETLVLFIYGGVMVQDRKAGREKAVYGGHNKKLEKEASNC